MRLHGVLERVTFAVISILAVVGASMQRTGAQNVPSNAALQPIEAASGVTARAIAVASKNAYRDLLLIAAEQPNRILSLAPDARLGLFAGTGQSGSLGDGGMAVNAQLDLETDSTAFRSSIALAPDGSLFIADTRNSTIRRVASSESTEPGVIRSVEGRWASQQTPEVSEPLGQATHRAGKL